jgi:hypothetical protein
MSRPREDSPAWTTVDEGWGRKAADFSSLSEPSKCREYVALHHHLRVDPSDKLLDVACGSGLAVELARLRGASCPGIDALGPIGRRGAELEAHGRSPARFPHALVTMWAWITNKRSEAERVPSDILSPLLKRDPSELRARAGVGSATQCAELLSRYALAGSQQVHFWPVGEERRQVELIASEVGRGSMIGMIDGQAGTVDSLVLSRALHFCSMWP